MNTNILKTLVEKVTNGNDGWDYFKNNEDEIVNTYKNSVSGIVAEKLYSDMFDKLKSNQLGCAILSTLEKEVKIEEKDKKINKLTAENAESKEQYRNTSEPERLFCCMMEHFITGKSLESKVGIYTQRFYRTPESILKTVYGKKIKKGTPSRRASDCVLTLEDIGSDLIFLFDGKGFHDSKRDSISSKSLSANGSVKRLREKGTGKISKEFCEIANYSNCNLKNEENLKKFIKTTNNFLNKNLSTVIPEAKDYKFDFEEIKEIYDNLDYHYNAILEKDILEQLTTKELTKINEVADKLLSKNYSDKRAMLEEFLKLNLTFEVKKSLLKHDEERWTKVFNAETYLRQTVRNLNKKENK